MPKRKLVKKVSSKVSSSKARLLYYPNSTAALVFLVILFILGLVIVKTFSDPLPPGSDSQYRLPATSNP